MKKRNRLFAILLALAMVLTLMPSLAFADEKEGSWYLYPKHIDELYYDKPVQLWVPIKGDYSNVGIKFEWFYYNPVLKAETPIPGNDLTNIVSTPGEYSCKVSDKYGNEEWVEFNVHYEYHSMQAGGYLFWNDDLTHAGAEWDYIEEKPFVGAISVPPTVVLDDGKVYTVTHIGTFANNTYLTSVTLPESITTIDAFAFLNTGLATITIPAGVTKIGDYAIGYNEVKNSEGKLVYNRIPGFVIVGKTGSVTHAYAINNGIAFRDPEAEAIAAWNGTPDTNIAKAKTSKPKAAKKSFTVKWKKLSSKQLKNGGVTNYEVQYSLNKSFPMNETTTKFVSKKKSSYKAKNLKAKKTYYVRVRAIRNVGGVKYVGGWSNQKVKVK